MVSRPSRSIAWTKPLGRAAWGLMLRAIAAPALLLAAGSPVAAQGSSNSILIWPVNPVITADVRAAALWLENPGKTPKTLQVRIFAWSQAGGENGYSAQDVILATPPIVTIAAGSKQLVRITRTRETAPGREDPYRIVVDEVPVAGATQQAGAAVSFRMRYSIPLFVYGAGALPVAGEVKQGPQPKLVWRVINAGAERHLEIRNDGPVHARLTEMAFRPSSGPASALNQGLWGYVLPGETMRWKLQPEVVVGDQLVGSSNGGPATRLEPRTD
jgi:fimbrial chaperone protein